MNSQYCTPHQRSDEQMKASFERLSMVNYFHDLIPSAPEDAEEMPRVKNIRRRSHNLCPTSPPRSVTPPKQTPTSARNTPETKIDLANLDLRSRIQFYRLQELKLSEGRYRPRSRSDEYPCKSFPSYIDHDE